MVASIPDDKIQLMREGVDILQLVSRYVPLKRSGANHVGLCPFHNEKSPSFSVNPARQIFKCFGCGVGGDAFEFLMRIEGLSFPEAAQRIAGEMGVDIEEHKLSAEEEHRRQQRESLQRVNALAAEFFHRQLLDTPEAEDCRQYLNRRGYGRTSAAEYQLGYAPDRWDALIRHLTEQGVDLAEARTLGLIRSRENANGDYDLFRGRLIFPIHDLSGRIIGFGGRILGDGKPKYINSPESLIYHKGEVLFGLYNARQSIRQAGEVILVEGYFDQLALVRAGFNQAVATCGTALTVEHAQLLKRYAQRILLLFDQDAAGRSATFKAMDLLLPQGLDVLVVELEAGEDPDSCLQSNGVEAFGERVKAARSVLDLYTEVQLAEAAPGPAGIARAAQQILEKLLLLPNRLEVDLSLKALAQRTGIDFELLRTQFQEVQQQATERAERASRYAARNLPPEPRAYDSAAGREERSAPPDVAPPSPRKHVQRLTPADGTLLKMLIFEAEVRQEIETKGVEAFFYDPFACELAAETLKHLRGVAKGQELTRLQQQPEFLQRLPQPLNYDPEAYVGLGQQMLDSSLQKIADRRRRQQLKSQGLGQAE